MTKVTGRSILKTIGNISIASFIPVLGSNEALRQIMFSLQPALPAVSFIKINPSDNGKALVNPDIGWTMHFYSNIIDNYGSKLEPSDALDDFPGLSTVYLRLPLSFIEQEEGLFNREILYTPFTIARTFIDPVKAFFRGIKPTFMICVFRLGKRMGHRFLSYLTMRAMVINDTKWEKLSCLT